MAKLSRNEKILLVADILNTWGMLTSRRLRRKIHRMQIKDTEDLLRSIQVKTFKGNTEHLGSLHLMFDEHGRFVDMGVGRPPAFETIKSNGDQLTGKSRRPRKWYSKTFYGSLDDLYQMLIEGYQFRSLQVIKELESKRK